MERNEFDQYLIDYLEGELPPEKVDELLALIEHDAELRAEFDAYQEQDKQLHRYFQAKFEQARLDKPQFGATAAQQLAPASNQRWLLAAAALLLIVFSGAWPLYRHFIPTGASELASIRVLDGTAQVMHNGQLLAAKAGDALRQGEKFKLLPGGYAELVFPEGNLLEIDGGSQLRLEDYHDRLEVRLNRGRIWAHLTAKPDKIIVVQTAQLKARATSSVLGVNESMDRTEALAAEGTVSIEQNGALRDVAAGGTYTSREGTKVAELEMMLKWSRYPSRLSALLPPPAKTAEPVRPQIIAPEHPVTQARTADSPTSASAAQLLEVIDLMPEQTRFFVGIDDWPRIMHEFDASEYRTFLDKPELRVVWEAINQSSVEVKKLLDLMAWAIKIVKIPSGAIAFSVDHRYRLLIVADTDADEAQVYADLHEALKVSLDQERTASELPRVWAEVQKHLRVVNGRLIISSDLKFLEETLKRNTNGPPGEFRFGEFYEKVKRETGDADFVIACDLAGIVRDHAPAPLIDTSNGAGQDEFVFSMEPAPDNWGLQQLDFIVIAPQFAGRGMNQAARLVFRDKRAGVFDLLGEPAPMRGLDFFSPDVNFFCSAILSDWNRVIEEAAKLNPNGPAAEQVRHDLDTKLGGNLRPFLASIGQEITIGIDNPLLPMPNVILALEVVDREKFAAGMAEVEEYFRAEFERVDRAVVLLQTTHKNIEINSISIDKVPVEPAWAFVDDFCIAGLSPEFVRHAIEVHLSGNTISRHNRLLALLPKQGAPAFSFLIYQDIAKAIPALMNNKLMPLLSSEQSQYVPQLNFLEQYSAAGIAFGYAFEKYIDLHFNAPSGVDLNMGMAVPLIATWFLPKANAAAVLNKYLVAQSNLTDLRTAVKRFSEQNGRLPRSLAEVAHPAGKYIAAIPADPYAGPGETLRLIQGKTDHEIIIYSIGPDQEDQFGEQVYDPNADVNGPGDVSVKIRLGE